LTASKKKLNFNTITESIKIEIGFAQIKVSQIIIIIQWATQDKFYNGTEQIYVYRHIYKGIM